MRASTVAALAFQQSGSADSPLRLYLGDVLERSCFAWCLAAAPAGLQARGPITGG